MIYEFMRLVLFFDLPMKTKKEVKTSHVKPKRQHTHIVFCFFNYIIEFFLMSKKGRAIMQTVT